MAWVETATSRQDISYTNEGYLSFTRTFKVWDISTDTFWGDPSAIGNDPNAPTAYLPAVGSVFVSVNGPNPLIPKSGDGAGVSTNAQLTHYSLSPISPVIYTAIAHYSNDPAIVPLGQSFRAQQLSTLAPMPFVRTVDTITGGAATTDGAVSYIESVVQVPMACQRISQSVSLRRPQIKDVQQAIAVHANELHTLPVISGGNAYSRFDGADIHMRGAQWIDVTYNWTWEQGVVEFAPNNKQTVVDDQGHVVSVTTAIYPPQISPLYAQFVGPGGSQKYILPPYHTVEMFLIQPSEGVFDPVWQYRLPYRVVPDLGSNNLGWAALPGSKSFIWGTGANP